MRTTLVYLCLSAALTFAYAAAYHVDGATTANDEKSRAATTSSEVRADTGGNSTVSGTVKLEGPRPLAQRIDMTADPACLKMHPAAVMSEEAVEGPNGALKNVVVYISDGLQGRSFDPPKEPVQFDQKGCTYSPHVLGVRASQPLKISNTDPTTHNIHPAPQNNREWNMSQPPGSSPIEETFARQEIIPVKCNVHPWMRGYIAVFKHPYFAVTDKNGGFQLKNVPPGKYTIQAWHEKYGVASQTINLNGNQNQEVEFTFKP